MLADLKARLDDYAAFDETEEAHLHSMRRFLAESRDHFSRANTIGHFTASAMVMNPGLTATLFTHHLKLDKWLQLGGHVEEDDTDILSAAIREAAEESGIANITAWSPEIFDLDAHAIPAHPAKNEPAHMHFDVRFLLIAPEDAYTVSDESHALKWFTLDEVATFTAPEMVRMAAKWRAIATS